MDTTPNDMNRPATNIGDPNVPQSIDHLKTTFIDAEDFLFFFFSIFENTIISDITDESDYKYNDDFTAPEWFDLCFAYDPTVQLLLSYYRLHDILFAFVKTMC